jgi:hypothetical protein
MDNCSEAWENRILDGQRTEFIAAVRPISPGARDGWCGPDPYSGADWPRYLNAGTAAQVSCPPFVRDGASSLSEKPSLNEKKQHHCLSGA